VEVLHAALSGLAIVEAEAGWETFQRTGLALPLDIAGQEIANPLGAILSGALLARHLWGCPDVANTMEAAVANTHASGVLTPTWPPPARRRLAPRR
jgi:isocitrate dehydrogenase